MSIRNSAGRGSRRNSATKTRPTSTGFCSYSDLLTCRNIQGCPRTRELHQGIQTGGQFNDTCPRSDGLTVTTRKHGWVINLMTNHLRSGLYHQHQYVSPDWHGGRQFSREGALTITYLRLNFIVVTGLTAFILTRLCTTADT